MIDLKTIDDNLAKAKEDVIFWENAKALLMDPRISQMGKASGPAPTPEPVPPAVTVMVPGPRPYGELKRKVYETLPEAGESGMTTAEISFAMLRAGFVFNSRVPAIAVNEALASLGEQVQVVGKKGLAKLWTKGERQEPEQSA